MNRIQREFTKTLELISKDKNSFFDKVELIDNDFRIWKVIVNLPESDFRNQLKSKTGETKVEFQLRFPDEPGNSYPAIAPKLMIVPKIWSTYTTFAGGMCLEILSKNGWSSTTSVETFMISVVYILTNRTEIYETKKGRNTDHLLAYKETDTFIERHNWNKSEKVKIEKEKQ